jgi:hypothetical protein
MSSGAIAQLFMGFQDQFPGGEFYNSPTGRLPCYPGILFGDPCIASAGLIQSCSWQAGNPLVHYTIQDITNPEFNQEAFTVPLNSIGSRLASSMSNSVCSLGEINPDYNSGAVEDEYFDLAGSLFQIEFTGAADLPCQIWASTNVLNWSQIGTAAQPLPGIFQFEDPVAMNYPARYYQVRLP